MQDIIQFLTSHMRDPIQFNCMPHVLSETSRSFALSGRDKALNSAADAFKAISEPIEAFDRIERKIPICSGISSSGKTRVLEEWERVFDLAEIPSPRCTITDTLPATPTCLPCSALLSLLLLLVGLDVGRPTRDPSC